jgi:hypothetical protein
MEEAHGFNIDFNLLYINLKQVYDTEHRKYLQESLREYKIHKKLITDCQHSTQKF